jgi:beta-alanine--pyruvate transaminase
LASSISPAPSRWAIPRPSNAPRSSSTSPRRASTICSSPTLVRVVETALKIALAYHRAKGNGSKVRLIGRERGYHGVNFGGTSVGGIANNRKWFGTLLSGVDHLRHTHDLARNAFSRGEPEYGAELADDLERLVALHDASTIAAVIVEPVACSTGVLIPPKGYLKGLAAICAKHDILLIFDEVITAFGRLGAPFGADYFGVSPDIITTAKGITNGTIPMGAVLLKSRIYDAFMAGAEEDIDLFHGYTYSGHPVACAACIATLEVYKEEGLLTRGLSLRRIGRTQSTRSRAFPTSSISAISG